MKKLPKELDLIELLQLAKETEQKARDLNQMGEKFAQKWETCLEDRNKNVHKL